MKPIVILGMHRSGTSLTAQCLSKNGLFFGKPEELPLLGNCWNPEGYFEFKKVVETNGAILEELGGDWIEVPKDIHKKLLSLGNMESIKQTINYLSSNNGQYWGMKDPRLMLTYKLWNNFLPNHKVVFCIRNPAEVVDSLIDRRPSTFSVKGIKKWTALWLEYMRRGLNQSKNSKRHFVFFEDYFNDNREQTISNLLNFCELPIKETDIVKDSLRHNCLELGNNKADLLYQELYSKYHTN
jgi:hypothetical protein